MSFWADKTALVTGGNGFLGKHLVEELRRAGCARIAAPRSAEFDLTRPGDAAQMLESSKPDILFHLASVCGGIGANRAEPGRFFYANAMMGLALIEAARVAKVPKLVLVGSICAYPKFSPVPFREENLWDGYPEETNAPYGLAKKMLLVQAQAYRAQYRTNAIYLLPVNLYGPHDNFDLETSHVIPAMIRKFETARKERRPSVALWGTGSASREFLYAPDCAEGLRLAAERYDGPEPVNLGAGFEITIRDLAETVRRLVDYPGEIEWDASKPDGQPKRMLDTSRARECFGFRARTPFEEGLARTIAWFREAGA